MDGLVKLLARAILETLHGPVADDIWLSTYDQKSPNTKAARACLAAIAAAGYQIVPKEPTQEMKQAGYDASGRSVTGAKIGKHDVTPEYRAMLAAAKIEPSPESA